MNTGQIAEDHLSVTKTMNKTILFLYNIQVNRRVHSYSRSGDFIEC